LQKSILPDINPRSSLADLVDNALMLTNNNNKNSHINFMLSRSLAVALTVTLLTACGGDGTGDGNGGSQVFETGDLLCNIYGSSTAVDSLPVVMVSDVPADGAAITTERIYEKLTFEQPLVLLQPPADDRAWYLAERAGKIFKFKNNTGGADDAANDAANNEITRDSTDDFSVFIDLTAKVDSSYLESGLLGMAFHPDYASNYYVYLSYTGDDRGLVSYISRFESLDGGVTLEPASEKVLITVTQPFENNNGGNLAFGADGYLYIGFGDGGGINDPNALVRDPKNLFGSLLRIDVDNGEPYAIPADNPFPYTNLCSNGSSVFSCPEIYACGFRNPWRWSFDSLTGDLWAGDVGQTEREEIDTVVNNGNYGWPWFEGTLPTGYPGSDETADYVSPVTEYTRSPDALPGTLPVIGGYVYRGADITDLIGVYVYGDLITKKLYQYYLDEDGTLVTREQDTDLFIVSFAQDNDGELYILDYDAVTDQPTGIHRIIADDD
jgi:glucose/arabinose dehydrogenase